jgi:hypothetical protein
MSNLFDDLARTLAQPMPRRGALRALGVGLAVAAIPGLRARDARASGTVTCRANEKKCSNGKGSELCVEAGGTCCEFGPESGYSTGLLVGCRKGYTCGGKSNGVFEACKCSTLCQDGSCCPRNIGRCVNGTCCPAIRTTFRPGSNRKGVACCPPTTVAVKGGVGLCCPKNKPNCCEKHDPRAGDDELSTLGPGKGQLCVKGKLRNV